MTDAQLLARFVATRDEGAFEALVRRHGPMVLGVCRRVLGHEQDAEDAFQATFLVLARKAPSVRNREAVGGWLYGVAYRAAVEAGQARSRRRARERQVDAMPHPEVQPPEPQDWRPLLDRELAALPQKYRAAVVLCDLEGRTRREAARQLGLPEGTLSSRLATGRRMLAERLSRRGVVLSGGALAAALSQSAASAQVPAQLVWSTAKAAAGNLAASSSAAVLMKGVLRAMFLANLKLVLGVVLVVAVLGAGGLAYRAGGARAAPPERPRGDPEELRRENEPLRLNLRIVLEKCRAQQAELVALRGQVKAAAKGAALFDLDNDGLLDLVVVPPRPDPAREVEKALKALREARDSAAKRRAVDALDRAMGKLKEQLKEGSAPAKK